MATTSESNALAMSVVTLGCIGLAVCLAGAIGPWAAAPVSFLGEELPGQPIRMHGLQEWPGVVIAIAAATSALLLAAMLATRKIRFGIAAGLLGVAIVCISMISLGEISSRDASLFIVEVRAVPQWGVYVSLVGGLLSTVAAFASAALISRGWVPALPGRRNRARADDAVRVVLKRRD